MRCLYSKNWEKRLERKLLESDMERKKAYICSPLSALSDTEVMQNMYSTRAYMYYVVEQMELLAKAPHAYLPMLFCDKIKSERVMALQYGLDLLETCDYLMVCGNRISEGMRGEIMHAAIMKLPIFTFHVKVYTEVLDEVRRSNGDISIVYYDMNHPLLAKSNPLPNTKWKRFFRFLMKKYHENQ